ncbi:TPA: hypothetical protein ACH3X1_008663 [Trebouxia sp. C0004]
MDAGSTNIVLHQELQALRVQKDSKHRVGERLAAEQDTLFFKVDECEAEVRPAIDAIAQQACKPTQNVREALAKIDGLLQSWRAAVQETQNKGAPERQCASDGSGMTDPAADGIQDQECKHAQASLLASNNSLDTVVHDLNGRHTLELMALRKTHDARAAELTQQVSQLQIELGEKRRAWKQQGERANLADKALRDRQAQLDLAYQRITAADAASHEGKSKAQALQADLTSARQEAAGLKVEMDAELARLKLQLDAAVKKNGRLDQQLNSELARKSSQLEAEVKTNEGLLKQLRDEENKSSLLRQQLDDAMKKNSKVLQQLSSETKENSKVTQQLDAELKKKIRLLQQLETEQRKSGEAEQLRLSNARTIRQLSRQMMGQMVQANAAYDRAEARSAAATNHRQKQVSAHKSELDSMSQAAQAEARELQQQLTEAQAEAKSAAQQMVSLSSQLTAMTQKAEASEEFVQMVLQQQMTDAQAVTDALKLQQQLSDAQAVAALAHSGAKQLHQQLSDSSISADLAAQKLQQQLSGAPAIAESAQADAEKLHKQLSDAFTSADLDVETLQQQLAEAPAAGASASADTKQVLQQQPLELQPSIEQLMAAQHAELLAKEPASAEQMSILQKELKQLRTTAGHMKVDLEAAQQSQMNVQAEAATLQQELQDLQSSTAKARLQMQGDVTGLQGQLQTALAECKRGLRKKETAHADSAQSAAKELQKQLSEAVISSGLDTKKLQQQLTEAQAAVESAQAGAQKALQQQRTELQARGEQSKKLSMAAHHAELTAKEREEILALEVSQAKYALNRAEPSHPPLISQLAAAQNSGGALLGGQNALALELQQQVVPIGVHQQHAIAQLEQKHQRPLADLVQQPADAEERAQS